MEGKLQTSFIPRKDFDNSPPPAGFSVSIFSIVAVTLFVVSVVLSVGVFIYQRTLAGEVSQMNATLAKAKSSYEPNFIEKITELYNKIEAAKGIMKNHVAASRIFDFLENNTLTSVRFKSLSYKFDRKGQVEITMAGEAKSFSAVALQSDVFGGQKIVKDPVFDNLDLDESGNVTFQFKAVIDPDFLLYKNLLAGEAAVGGNAAAGASSATRSATTNLGGGDNAANSSGDESVNKSIESPTSPAPSGASPEEEFQL